MKYIIEIEEMPFTSEGSEMQLFKATEFNSLVFDRNGLEKLTPYDESAAEQRGQEEAWKLACHLYNVSPDVTDVIYQSMNGGKGLGVALEMSYAEASEKYEKYEAWRKQKDELKIGDEVMHDAHRRCVLLEKKDVCEGELWSVIDEKGVVCQINRKYIHRKTGRTFPEVADLIEKMRKPE